MGGGVGAGAELGRGGAVRSGMPGAVGSFVTGGVDGAVGMGEFCDWNLSSNLGLGCAAWGSGCGPGSHG